MKRVKIKSVILKLSILIIAFTSAIYTIPILISEVSAQSSCTPQSLGCAPFSGATSGFWSCSGCQESNCCSNSGGTTTHCISGCGGGGGGPCVERRPAQPIIQHPAGGSVVYGTYVQIQPYEWDWGHNCSINDYGWRYYIDVDCNLSAPAPDYYQANNPYFGLTPGVTYCVWVYAVNYTLWSDAAFTWYTAGFPPIVSSSSLVGMDVCGTRTSGRAGSPEVTNPFTYEINYQATPGGNLTPSAFGFMLLPRTGPYAENREYVEWETGFYKSVYARTFALLHYTPGGVKYFMSSNQSFNWDYYTAGVQNITTDTGGATFMGIGTDTTFTVDPITNTSRAKYKIRIENNFPSGQYALYAIAIMADQNGNMAAFSTHYDQVYSAYNYVLKKVGNWDIDTVAPSVNVGAPVLQPNGDFNINWQYSDNLGVSQLHSYIDSDLPSARLRDLTGGFDIDALDAPPIYPTTPSNAGLVPGGQQNRLYQDLSAASFPSYNFSAYVKDAGCNTASSTSSKSNQQPWVMDLNGHTSGKGGIPVFKIPNIPSMRISQFNIENTQSILSTFQSISGNTDLPTSRASRFDQYISNYFNEASDEYKSNQSIGFYEFLNGNARKNIAVSNLVTLAGNRTANVNISQSFSVAQNSKYVIEVNGNLTVNIDTVCDTNAMIFVSGTLTLNPNFTTSNGNVCIFVSKGNATIGAGTYRSNGISANDTTQANYDSIEAFIITDGTLDIPVDNPSPTFIGDALRIKGGVYGSQFSNKRILNEIKNQLQPAFLIEYDAKYKQVFKDLLDYRRYSIREVGLE